MDDNSSSSAQAAVDGWALYSKDYGLSLSEEEKVGHNLMDYVMQDIEKETKKDLESEAVLVIASTIAAMVSTLHDFGENLPDFREFDKVEEFYGGEYNPPSHCLSFNAVVPIGEEDELENEKTDRYGFYVTDKYRRPKNAETDDDIEHKREEKWRSMSNDWVATIKKEEAKVKSRIRKGIPNNMRHQIWPLLLDAKAYEKEYPTAMVRRMVVNLETRLIDEIDRDVGRTFPSHQLFRREGSEGQQNLRKMLLWYASVDSEVGYCQGMAFIAATLLVYLPLNEAFYCFGAMMNKNISGGAQMRHLYLPKMTRIMQMMQVFSDLLRNHLPKLFAHLTKEGIDTSMFVTQWFMTMYCRDFSFDLVARIWDCFLFDDAKIVYRVGLALLKVHKEALLKGSFEEIMALMRELPSNVDANSVMNECFKLRVTTQEIEKLEALHITPNFK